MKKAFLVCCFLIFVADLSAQNILLPDHSKASKIRPNIGGNIGFHWQNDDFLLTFAPRLGWNFSENFEVAFNLNYTYRNVLNTKYHILGLGPEISYFFNNFSANVMYLYNDVSMKSKHSQTLNFDENALFLGVGYRQYISTNTYMYAGMRYNVLYKEGKSVFSSAFTPYVGISVGL